MELLDRLAPDFTLQSDSSEGLTLSSLRGTIVVLFFYPAEDGLDREMLYLGPITWVLMIGAPVLFVRCLTIHGDSQAHHWS
ncbi:MAG: redoxin domain-containing protein [Gemmatimonadaceae bacterium]